jgi:hypothetical protein
MREHPLKLTFVVIPTTITHKQLYLVQPLPKLVPIPEINPAIG